MIWPLHTKASAKYWLKVFLLYAAFEAGIQLLYFFTLNTFQSPPISDLEFHFIMWAFQCLLIWPIWYVAFAFRKQPLWIQIFYNTILFVVYTFFWYETVQDWVASLHIQLQEITKPGTFQIISAVDTWDYFHYQVLKHSFRLGWFFVAGFFYQYKKEEQQRIQLAVANKELQLNLMKWHLNPDFYFKTLNNISAKAKSSPKNCSNLILILSQVMEYIIYRSKDKFISVGEELAFLHNYIYLQNLNKNAGCGYAIRLSGNHDNLQIIPLLLVSLVESHLQNGKNNKDQKQFINIAFQDRSMKINIGSGKELQNNHAGINEPLLMRLEEFYKKRYRFDVNNEKQYCFEMQLNEIG